MSIQVADRGPNAKAGAIRGPAPDTAAPFLTAMLDGVPPAEATPLSVQGVSPDELRAWRLGDRVYLRTRLTLISPEWTASEAAEGGLTVYSGAGDAGGAAEPLRAHRVGVAYGGLRCLVSCRKIRSCHYCGGSIEPGGEGRRGS